MNGLGVLTDGHNWSQANDINDAGIVVGKSPIGDDSSSQRPFIYSDGSMKVLTGFGDSYGVGGASTVQDKWSGPLITVRVRFCTLGCLATVGSDLDAAGP